MVTVYPTMLPASEDGGVQCAVSEDFPGTNEDSVGAAGPLLGTGATTGIVSNVSPP